MSVWRSYLLFICGITLAAGCGGDDNENQPEQSSDKQPININKKDPDKNEMEKVEDAGVPKEEDAGMPSLRFDLDLETSEAEFEKLIYELKEKQKIMALREREIVHREQLASSLEESVLKQVETLWRLKAEVSDMLTKLGQETKDERKAFEIAQKKAEENRLAVQKEQEAERAKKLAKFKEDAEEMNEQRAQRIVHLTATIKGMRASSGAGMLASMDEGDAVAVLRQLGSRQAAGLLGNMPPDRAAQLAGAMLGPKAPSAETLEKIEAKPETTPDTNDVTEKNDSEKKDKK